MNFRFYYEDEYEQERLPVLKASRVPVQEVAASLPEATRVSGSDRKREVAIRQKHIRQRLRGVLGPTSRLSWEIVTYHEGVVCPTSKSGCTGR